MSAETVFKYGENWLPNHCCGICVCVWMCVCISITSLLVNDLYTSFLCRDLTYKVDSTVNMSKQKKL